MRTLKTTPAAGPIAAACLLLLAAGPARAGGLLEMLFGSRPSPAPGPAACPPLLSGQAVVGLAGLPGARHYFQVQVLPGTPRLDLTCLHGTGDSDLYLARGHLPEPKTCQHISNGPDTRERITVHKPEPGTWYVLVYGYGRFEGVALTGSWDCPGAPVPVPVPAPAPGPPPRRWVRITAPAAGAAVAPGQTYWVEWQASADTRSVRVLQSLDGGRTWADLAGGRAVPAGVGRIAWTVPPELGRHAPVAAQVRIQDAEAPAVFDALQVAIVRPPDGRGGAVVRPGPGDAFEPDDDSSRAAQIGVNTEQAHTLYARGDEDWILFVPPTTGPYRLTLHGATVKLKVRLYAAKVGSSREDKNRTFTVGSAGYTIDLDVPPNVRYYKLHVQADDDGDTGAYRVAVQKVVPGRPGGLLPH